MISINQVVYLERPNRMNEICIHIYVMFWPFSVTPVYKKNVKHVLCRVCIEWCDKNLKNAFAQVNVQQNNTYGNLTPRLHLCMMPFVIFFLHVRLV